MATIRERLGIGPRQPGLAITAAATVLLPDDDKEKRRVHRGPEPWQHEAWDAYYALGEISYPMNYQAGALGRLRLIPAVQLDPREPPVPLDPDGDDDLGLSDDERAAMNATIDRLGMGTLLPMGELQRLLALNLALTGDSYLVGYNDADGEAWDVLSVEELVLDPNGRGYGRRAMGGSSTANTESFPEDAFIARLFQRDARFSSRAYSAMRSVLPLTDELRVLTDAIRAVATSRIPAGILALSHGFRGGPSDPTMVGQRDEASQDPVVQQYLEHFETPIKNRKSAAAVTPFLLFGEKSDITDGIKLIEQSRDVDRLFVDLRAEVVRRIGVGIDLPPEVLTGLGDVKYWNAQMIDQSTFKYHLEPDAQAMVYALTYGYYRPHLTKMGLENVGRCCMWYDPSPLVSHPNAAQDYAAAYDRIEVSAAAYRRVTGIPEDDAPDDAERARRIQERLIEGARTAPVIIPTQEQIEAGDVPVVEASGTTSAPTDAPASPTQAPPTSPPSPGPTQASVPPIAALTASAAIGPLGPRLTQIEKALRLRLLQKCDDAMTRTLEKAGNKLRSLANKHAPTRALVQKVDVLEVGQTLGLERLEQLATSTEDLLAGAFVGLEASWTAWVRRAQEQALAGIDEHGDLDEADAVQTRAEMDRGREEGWSVLHAGLLAVAARQLYAPNVEAPARGEWSDFRVDPSVVSAALREAGGGTSGTAGTSGLLSGSSVIDAIDKAGLTTTGYTWVHGDPVRDFEPHLLLDGQDFTGWDDEVLANGEDWPDTAYFSPNNGPDGPDHPDCSCLAELNISRDAIVDGGEE